MKLFTCLRNKYEILGISPNQDVNNRLRSFFHLFFLMELLFTAAIYLFVEAKNFQEYIDSFYGFATTAATANNIYSIIWNMKKVFELIKNIEMAIAKRNQQTIYSKSNEKIEKFSKRFYFIYARCTPIGVVLPILLMSFFIYFTTDSGRDSFQLIFLASYVIQNLIILFISFLFILKFYYIFVDFPSIGNHPSDIW